MTMSGSGASCFALTTNNIEAMLLDTSLQENGILAQATPPAWPVTYPYPKTTAK